MLLPPLITPSVKPAQGDEDSDKQIKPKLESGMGTLSNRPRQVCLIFQPSRKPHIDDNEFLSVASSSIEPDPVCRGNGRDTGAAPVPLSPVTSLYSALAD